MIGKIKNFIQKAESALVENADLELALALANFSANLVTETLLRGDTGQAFAKAGDQLPEQPTTLAARKLPGAENLDFTPYDSREALSLAICILHRVLKNGHTKYLPWLIEGLQLAFPGDRRLVVDALNDLPNAAQFCDQVSCWPGKINDARHIEAVFAGLSAMHDQIWMIRFLQSAIQNQKLLALAAKSPINVYDPAIRNDVEYTSELVDLLQTKDPYIAYGVVSVTSRRDLHHELFKKALAECLCAQTNSPLAGKLIKKTIELVCFHGVTLAISAEQFTKMVPLIKDRDLVRAFEFNHFGQHELAIECQGKQLQVHANVLRVTTDQDKIYGIYKILKKITSSTAWSTDEDEFGLIVVNQATATCEHFPLPVKFPIVNTCAAGAKRMIQSVAQSPSRIYFSLQNPYVRPDGRWGDESYIFSADKKDHSWHLWQRDGQSLVAVPISTPTNIAELPPTSGALLDFGQDQGKITLTNDCTAYPFEGAESDIRSFPGLDDEYLPWQELIDGEILLTQRLY